MPQLTPNLWFDSNGLEAAEFYVSVFPGSRITQLRHYDEATPDRAGEVVTVEFELDGHPFTIINGGPHFTQDEAFSINVTCDDQAEVDHYWEALLAGGGQESMCGWLKDRFGVSWQINPSDDCLKDSLWDPDPERAARATAAMYKMHKLDIEALRAAADG